MDYLAIGNLTRCGVISHRLSKVLYNLTEAKRKDRRGHFVSIKEDKALPLVWAQIGNGLQYTTENILLGTPAVDIGSEVGKGTGPKRPTRA